MIKESLRLATVLSRGSDYHTTQLSEASDNTVLS